MIFSRSRIGWMREPRFRAEDKFDRDKPAVSISLCAVPAQVVQI